MPAWLLGGCNDTVALHPLGLALGLAIAAALPLVAWLAHALGRQRAERHREGEIQQLREALRHERALHPGWTWETDAGHRPTAWDGPEPVTAGLQPLLEQPVVRSQLDAWCRRQQPFQLQVQALVPVAGSHGWQLQGQPRHGPDGGFAGFRGTARPTDVEDEALSARDALHALLSEAPLPLVLARPAGDQWRVVHASPAATALWSRLVPDTALAEALSPWPDLLGTLEPLREGVSPGPATSGSTQGWQWQRLSAEGRPPQLLLWRAAETASGGDGGETEQFSFTLSHDLRAPIRVVEGFTRIVKEDYGRQLDRMGNDHLDRVLGAAARMNLMIDALLTLARLSQQPLARQRVNLSQLAGYVVDELRRQHPEREVDVDIEPQLMTWGDATLLRLVLENLLGNAWKYSARAPRAAVSLREVPHGGQRAFCVRDNGAGFDMRSADRLFGLFQRLHSASDFPGHGVGLASVRRIVRRHGGQIWAESEPGKGAAFFFTLEG